MKVKLFKATRTEKEIQKERYKEIGQRCFRIESTV